MVIDIKEFRNTTWRLRPVLDVPDLQPPVVLFSVFDADPRPKFKEILRSTSGRAGAALPEATAGIDPKMFRHGQLTAMWDSLFREIPGNRISFLYQSTPPKGGVRSKRGIARRVTVHATVLASNEPPGTKWVVTRAILHLGRSVCWCVPVTVTTGKTSKVRLTPKNLMEITGGSS
jgi:hypothetical protein